MSGPHDIGGAPGGPIDKSQHEVQDWERLADALNAVLGQKGVKTTDEHRRAQESLPGYADLAYYERWTAANEALLIEKGILTREEIDAKTAEMRERWSGR
jgi:hypothetical protein